MIALPPSFVHETTWLHERNLERDLFVSVISCSISKTKWSGNV